MTSYVVAILVGIICVILGISNSKGNISSLHSYHRHRVSEEDRIPFGKKVGLGTIIIGSAVALFGVLSIIALVTEITLLSTVGIVALVIGLVVGLGITFYGMIKYNKGIF